jgi:hypothetical protein
MANPRPLSPEIETKARGSKDRPGEQAKSETSEKSPEKMAAEMGGFKRGEEEDGETCRAEEREQPREHKNQHEKTLRENFSQAQETPSRTSRKVTLMFSRGGSQAPSLTEKERASKSEKGGRKRRKQTSGFV